MASVNFYRGSGLPSQQIEEGSFILDLDSKTLWYSDDGVTHDLVNSTFKDFDLTITKQASHQPEDVTGYYKYEADVEGITAQDSPIADILFGPDTTVIDSKAMLTDWNKVYLIETAENKVYVYTESPISGRELNIALRVFRSGV